MKKANFLIIAVLALSYTCLPAQDMYIATNSLTSVAPGGWNFTLIGQFQFNASMSDIAFLPNGKMYGFDSITGTLYEIDPTTAAVSVVLTIPSPNNIYNGMVADKDGKLYLAYTHLIRIDPADLSITDLGQMPYSCAGDLLFWKGDLYMTAFENGLVKLNLQDLSQSTKYIDLPDDFNLFGMTTARNCLTGKTTVYVFTGTGDVLQVDMEQRTYLTVPNVDFPSLGATSMAEFEDAAPQQAVIDTILTVVPTCGQSDGSITVLPTDPAQQLSFSLDNVNWQTSGVFTGLPAGTYSIYLKNACTTEPLLVILPGGDTPLFTTLEFAPDGPHCKDAPFVVSLSKEFPQVEFTWSVNGTPVSGTSGESLNLIISQSGVYTIHVNGVDAAGCTYEGTFTDSLANCFEIPNVFTPNSDTVNDQFGPVTFGADLKFDMEIYNRWGRRVFKSESSSMRWDGTIDGERAVSDVYAYVIRTKESVPRQFSGSVTLLR